MKEKERKRLLEQQKKRRELSDVDNNLMTMEVREKLRHDEDK